MKCPLRYCQKYFFPIVLRFCWGGGCLCSPRAMFFSRYSVLSVLAYSLFSAGAERDVVVGVGPWQRKQGAAVEQEHLGVRGERERELSSSLLLAREQTRLCCWLCHADSCAGWDCVSRVLLVVFLWCCLPKHPFLFKIGHSLHVYTTIHFLQQFNVLTTAERQVELVICLKKSNTKQPPQCFFGHNRKWDKRNSLSSTVK